MQNFNPRSREGSDIHPIHAYYQIQHFNPCSREGSDVSWYDRTQVKTEFQSTLPRRERRMRAEEQNAFRDFNPRSREGSDAHLAVF